MTFKSKIGWPEFAPQLPTRHGVPQGASTENRMLQKTPADGIRTQMRNNPDGSVTMLRTRNGWPEFTTILSPAVKALDLARGFVAHVVSAVKSALFSPYSLEVGNPKYTLHAHTYSVLPFATTYNVQADDSTKWNDTISFKNGVVYVNAKPMPSLGITDAPSGYLPWLVPATGSDLEKYGTEAENTTVKRVFAVGRYRVESWFLDNSEPPLYIQSVLGGATYRPDRALLCGARVEESAHAAWLSQLAFTGSTWNSLVGSWTITQAQIAMLLTAPYLQKTETSIGVEIGSSALSGPVSSTFETHASYTLPETDCCAVGVGELGASNFSNGAYTQYREVIFPWRSVKKHAFVGTLDLSTARALYAESFSDSLSVTGLSTSIARENTLTIDNNSEGYSFPDTSVQLYSPRGSGSASVVTDSANFTPGVSPVWNGDSADAELVPRGGNYGSGVYFHHGSGLGNSAGYVRKTQSLSASITVGGFSLVSISASREKESGNKVVPAPITGRYSTALASPYDWVGQSSGFGSAGKVSVQLTNYDPVSPDVIGRRQPLIEARAATYVGGLYYAAWDLNSSDQNTPIYTSSIQARTTIDDQSLTWATRDFVLFDQTNGCYISVDASFSGSQHYGQPGDSALSVQIRIDTPSGVAVMPLFSTTIGYIELLPEKDIGSGVTAIPSPKQRLMFAPLYQAQGDFKGATYTTSAEVTAGATPAHLFNFVLKLDTFADIGTDTLNLPVVHFVPCNLLEMLYAYVFSSKCGVDDYERYPVDRVATFNSFQSSLFANQWRIAYRNGAFVDWLDTLGGIYIEPETTELYRI